MMVMIRKKKKKGMMVMKQRHCVVIIDLCCSVFSFSSSFSFFSLSLSLPPPLFFFWFYRYSTELKRQIVEMVKSQCTGDSGVKKTAARRSAIDAMKESVEHLDKLTPQMVSRWERAIDKVWKKKKKKERERERE